MDTSPEQLAEAGAGITSRAVAFDSPSPVNSHLTIRNFGPDGPGGALPYYLIQGRSSSGISYNHTIDFQNGTLPEVGINGVTIESLIAICVDQLQQFQAGPFSCRENALALTSLQEAKLWLDERTRERQRRGIEGTYAK